ncbi:aldehyde dehydrogenase [Nocardia otitidiscaviarum]|uniref:aldehyde dehydrogenase n=1 Tax=Nocardia otitidiscaviarum TaxID=1823 RepID=UPI0004A7276B|nr:aldehyde dehydrogenase [Nocardia otitidiscaviarum]MBF6132090.1 aldehyde dehydrogenase [Nocardia otitidiscaviarum]MBF6483220.1 aldehyde dehydrogenase [Nocardia otitidiscaviarum]
MITYDRLYIGGSWTEPTEPALLEILSPHDRSLIGRAAQAQPADVDRAVAAAHTSFENRVWRDIAPAERIAVLRRFNELREEQADRIAELITAENGSAAWFTKSGQAGLTRQANAYLTAAEYFDWERTITPSDPNTKLRSVVRREPVGVVAAVIPWNSPFSSATSKIMPALLTGNSVVLKASPENSLSMNLLAELVDRIGLPDGVVSVLPAERETSEYLISHPRVDKIAFTGSAGTGRRIATIAGEQLKRVSLELVSKSAAVILPDADLTEVIDGLKYGSLLNNGESCIAQTRILAPNSRYEEVVAALTALVESLPVGDPQDPATFIGPMVRGDQQQRVRDYIEIGIGEGARVVCGGPQLPPGLRDGFYVTPTVFADVTPDMRIAQEEIFGPVLVVIAYDDIDDAIRIANDSDYRLSGGVWSADEAAAVAVARRIRTGTVAINGAPVGFDGPLGGFKASGIGREFGAVGLGQYTEYQTIIV